MPHSDPEVRRAYIREWKKKNAERHAWLNKLADAAIHANRRAERFGVEGRLLANDVRTVFDRCGHRCFYCGSVERLGLDHVVPMSAGGANVVDNLVAACHSCNASKWQQDRPGRWSRFHDQCRRCGTSSRRHCSHGFCNACYLALRKLGALEGMVA